MLALATQVLSVNVSLGSVKCSHCTIMSDRCNDPDNDVQVIHRFSNPEIEHKGIPIGTPSDNNARAIRNKMVRRGQDWQRRNG